MIAQVAQSLSTVHFLDCRDHQTAWELMNIQLQKSQRLDSTQNKATQHFEGAALDQIEA